MDGLEKIDIGDGVILRPTYLSAHLSSSQKQELIELLKAYTCCFAWEYTKMPGLSRHLVEHRLPIKVSFGPYKQGGQNFMPELIGRVKEEVDQLLQARFIQPCRYADWVSNIVPVEKKNIGKMWITQLILSNSSRGSCILMVQFVVKGRELGVLLFPLVVCA
jgi:hypothetical protein